MKERYFSSLYFVLQPTNPCMNTHAQEILKIFVSKIEFYVPKMYVIQNVLYFYGQFQHSSLDTFDSTVYAFMSLASKLGAISLKKTLLCCKPLLVSGLASMSTGKINLLYFSNTAGSVSNFFSFLISFVFSFLTYIQLFYKHLYNLLFC